jgi:hypothetical protein
MMAEKDVGQPWVFYAGDQEQAQWFSFPPTAEAIGRAEEVLANITAEKHALQTREDLHRLVDSLSKVVLDAAKQALESL